MSNLTNMSLYLWTSLWTNWQLYLWKNELMIMDANFVLNFSTYVLSR